MSAVSVEVGEDVVEILRQQGDPIARTARELIVVELYRRHTISGGKAAELLGMDRYDFIRYAAHLGIPYFDMTEEEWDAEVARLNSRR
jgi:predicted HTH domain antitoxin